MANPTTLETKLADLRLAQTALIEIEQTLATAANDSTIRERLEGILESDRKNLSAIDEAIAKSGSTREAREITQSHISKVREMMDSSELTVYDKFFQLELLKHQQAMTGLVIHKVAQSLDDKFQKAVESLNKVNFENRAHQEVLKGVLYFVGTREMAGTEPDMGLLASLEQGIAAVKGAVGSAVS
ncbi:MAG: hemerythrin HHE cation-binding protein [Cyanobacteria bacterium P01_H01_bin.21]